MTTASTAFVMVGPSGVGSFHDRLWRVNPRQGQLVEGGTNGPYFLLGSSSEEFVFPVEDFDSEGVARSVVLLIALLIEDEQALGLLRATENLVETDRGERVAPFWDLDEFSTQELASRLAPMCRVGLVRLDETSILNREVSAHLQELGFDLTEFGEMADSKPSRFTDEVGVLQTNISVERKAEIEARLAELGIVLPNGVK